VNPVTIVVQAAPGVRVPQEGSPRRYITDAAPATVPDSTYYRRRIADGDLALTDPVPEVSAAPAITPKTAPEAASQKDKETN